MARFDFESMQRFIRSFDPAKDLHSGKTDAGSHENEEWQNLTAGFPHQRDGRWTLNEIEDTYQTLKKVYGEREEEFCEIIELTSEKFLDSYVDIDGIGQLFHSSYFYFEWMMHLEYNKSEHDYTYYRDHYVHQVKNMYEMFVFLNDLKYEKVCRQLYQRINNKVAELIRNSVKNELNCNAKWQADEKNSGDQAEEEIYRYLFFSSAIVAALLHDIGYPIAYIGRTVRELGDFLPFSHLFVQEVETISTIQSVLQDSLLYKVAGEKEVAERVGKRDHGALSAVILLYKYYDNGKIAMLSPVKRAVIEISALMIYNHTLKYRNQGKKKSEYYKNIFRENPMSFLFRLCDDLQEWNRIYFDISQSSNFFICGNCYMPMTKSRTEQKVRGRERKYSCWCGREKGRNTTTFAYRRLFNIDACRYLEVNRDDGNIAEQEIKIVYDKGRLLQIAAYNPSFAMKRGEGIWEIKKMLERQPEFPNTYVDFFISNNPILLKAEILLDWLKKHYREFCTETNRVVEKIGKAMVEDQAGVLINTAESLMEAGSSLEGLWREGKKTLENVLKARDGKWENKAEKMGSEDSISFIWKKTDFYCYLAFLGNVLQCIDKKAWGYIKDKEGLKGLAERVGNMLCTRFGIVNREETRLAALALYQKCRQFDKGQFEKITTEGEWQLYFSSFQYNHYDMVLAAGYVQEDGYGEIKEGAEKAGTGQKAVPVRYDYYSDYYFYWTVAEMNEKENNHESDQKSAER